MKLTAPTRRTALFTAALALLAASVILSTPTNNTYAGPSLSPYPHGKNFAFTITDDPDNATLENMMPIYDFLSTIGLKTTIAVWVRNPERSNGMPDTPRQWRHPPDSCHRPEYLAYLKQLQAKGFEIALHTVSAGNDVRAITAAGYEDFRRLFSYYPRINIMHSNNLENVYWGPNIVANSRIRSMIRLLPGKARYPWGGDDPKSMYFWGDILKAHTKYVRLWGTADINTLKFNPSMPYHNPDTPYVNYWFSFSDGWNGKTFLLLTSHANIERLVNERGASIVYAHLSASKELCSVGGLNPRFVDQMLFLASRKDGWFVTASELLNRLLLMKYIICFSAKGRTVVFNSAAGAVDGVTLRVRPNEVWRQADGSLQAANDEGELLLGNLGPGRVLLLQTGVSADPGVGIAPGSWERLKMIVTRVFLYLKHSIHRAYSRVG